MTAPRRIAVVAGLLYYVTHVTSVAAAVLYGGSNFDPTAPLAGRTPVLIGAALELILAMAVVGTAAALYPLIRHHSPAVAASYLGLRTLEASAILAGVVALLPVVATPSLASSPQLSPDVVVGLRLVHDWTFLIGPGLIVPVHTATLAWLLWRTRLVPRVIPALGLVGGPLVGVMNLVVFFGIGGVFAPAVIPVFAWEVTLAGYLILRGLRHPDQIRSHPHSTGPVMAHA